MKKRALKLVADAVQSLPDFSADWQLAERCASKAEVEARFYYEFARESQTILSLTEKLCHLTRPEIPLNYPGHGLAYLHPYSLKIVDALMPAINLREVSWSKLGREQKNSLIREFSRREPAFRQLKTPEFIDFTHCAMRATCWRRPTERNHTDSTAEPPDLLGPWWYGNSRLFWSGVEQIAIRIDWNQGPQAVKGAIEKWFQGHKRKLTRFKSEGKFPDAAGGSFHVRDETGAKNPRRRCTPALRGLGAMRMLGSHTLLEAIRITEGSGRKGDSLYYGFLLDTGQPAGRSAWNRGIENARKTFHELFYPQDEYLLQMRRRCGLPEIEEPISYQRYCLRRRQK
jgi:hypothetical protein